ncbi:hypothetical protein ABT297_34535 [Dactylosporangium sp. NPDC000555]|uniref:hypothetical protein n=1 Tax=Dactylosporangium sp. NPDC000555 TaxID=3154260 RepID=UPI00332ED62A
MPEASVAPPVPVGAPREEADPDQAWRTLGLVTDWIRHAETKIEAVVAGRTALVRHLARQVHADATIAWRRYCWADRAVLAAIRAA